MLHSLQQTIGDERLELTATSLRMENVLGRAKIGNMGIEEEGGRLKWSTEDVLTRFDKVLGVSVIHLSPLFIPVAVATTLTAVLSAEAALPCIGLQRHAGFPTPSDQCAAHLLTSCRR